MNNSSIIQGSKLKEVLREQIRNAILKEEIAASEVAEFYLVNLLSEYHRMEHLLSSSEDSEKPLAILLLETMNGDSLKRIRSLKRLGDTALLAAGFFADSIRRGPVDSSYYISIGGAAYGSLSYLYEGQVSLAELYSEMAAKFASFVEVLGHVAPWNQNAANDSELIRIYERWLVTGDERLKRVLEEKGICTVL